MSVRLSIAFTLVGILFLKLNEATDTSQNYEIVDPDNLGKSYSYIGDRKISDQILCLAQCNKECLCRVVLYSSLGKCIFYKNTEIGQTPNILYQAYASEFQIFRKKGLKIDTITDGLIHHWPFFHSAKDIVGGKDITNGFNSRIFCWFGNDRENSALRLRNGYFEVPTGVNLNTGFTITAWVKIIKITSWSTLIDLENDNKNITIALCDTSSIRPSLTVQPGGVLMAGKTLTFNFWTHLAFTIQDNLVAIYINGQLNIRGNLDFLPENNYTPTRIHVGKSNQNSSENAFVDIIGLKIFNRAFTSEEIKYESTSSAEQTH